MKLARFPDSPARAQHGLSLVELMIAMTLGLIVLAGVMSLFMTNKKSYTLQTAVARIQEGGRFSFDFLAQDVRQAGYMGCLKNANLVSYLDTSSPNTNTTNFGDPVNGYEAAGDTTDTGPGQSVTINTVPPVTAGTATFYPSTLTNVPTLDTAIAGKAIAGSDLLVIHRVNTQPIYVTDVLGSGNSANVQVTTSAGIAAGQFGIVTDCGSGALFQITKLPGSNKIQANTGSDASPGNHEKPWKNDGVKPGSSFYAPDTLAYFIGVGADGSPALFKADADNATTFTTQELVSGVENMQILYGVDTDTTADGIPNQYVTARNVAKTDWTRVVNVRIGLLVRSDLGVVTEPIVPPATSGCVAGTFNVLGTCVTAPSDTRLRRVFVATFSLRNQLP
ncbi:MAG TPA: PilW family protein [Gammaproteobacteria bacterium]|nr:PilW family protein [Gammaproteobacteria bacterium]